MKNLSNINNVNNINIISQQLMNEISEIETEIARTLAFNGNYENYAVRHYHRLIKARQIKLKKLNSYYK